MDENELDIGLDVEENIEEIKKKEENGLPEGNGKEKHVPIYEQETIIQFCRDEKSASIYTSDKRMQTKMDKLCAANPDMYHLVDEDWGTKEYVLKDRTLISLRAKKRELTEEQRNAAAERLRAYWGRQENTKSEESK